MAALTKQIFCRELHLQLFWVQYDAGRLVTQYQIWRDLRDGQSTTGVLGIHQQTILKTRNQIEQISKYRPSPGYKNVLCCRT